MHGDLVVVKKLGNLIGKSPKKYVDDDCWDLGLKKIELVSSGKSQWMTGDPYLRKPPGDDWGIVKDC